MNTSPSSFLFIRLASFAIVAIEKSELFANKKQRGPELWISRITAGLSIAFFVLAIITSFFVDRM